MAKRKSGSSKPKDEGPRLVESDNPNGPWTPVDIKPQVLDLETARLTNPDLNYYLPIDHRTPLGTTPSGAQELLGLQRIEIIRSRFGPSCTLSDVKRWLLKQGLRFEEVNWTDVLGFIKDERSTSKRDEPTIAKQEPFDDDAPVSPGLIAERCDIPIDRLRKRLERLKSNNEKCFVEVQNRRKNEPKYLYYWGQVKEIVYAMKRSDEMSNERPAGKISQ
jgi:hypothetical protein